MNIEIYINGRPAESYTEEEMKEIRKKLTYTAMKAAGYVPVEEIKLDNSSGEEEQHECQTIKRKEV